MRLFVAAKAFLVREGKVLLLRESTAYTDGTSIGKWDVPGGRLEPDESLLAGLAREVREESGLIIGSPELLHVQDTFQEIRGEKCHIVRVYYQCVASGTVVLSRPRCL